MDELEMFGKGGIREDIPDPRDYQWGRDVGMAAIPFDWSKGYDIEQIISDRIGKPFKIKVKNQNGSSSCGGQAWSYLGQVLSIMIDSLTDPITDELLQEKSAKFIYAHTHVGTGGSDGRQNCELVINKGWGNEADCLSYQNGLAPSEEFMIDKASISPQAFANALKDRGLAYANVLDRDPENIATAVRDNYGVVFGLTGSNNGTWRSPFPKPPTAFANSWNHWLYIGKAKLINGEQYFGTLNSWGTEVGEDGWQWLSATYIKTFILGYPVIWSVWTMVAKADVVIPTPFKFTMTLKLGMKNGEVLMLQKTLGGLMTDGYFGPKTLAKVKSFQTAHGLKADGVVGAKTRVELNKLL